MKDLMKDLRYQRRAIGEVSENIEIALEAGDNGQAEVGLIAPTGSGKTYMVSKTLEKTVKEHEVCFLWLSIGKGSLHEQSKKSVEKHINSNIITCCFLDGYIDSGKRSIEPNTILFCNWESLNHKDKITGKWTCRSMREQDGINLPKLIKNTKISIILIIDERHVAADTDRALEIRKLINADVLVSITATPKYIEGGFALTTKISLQEVMDEGMIIKGLDINDGLGMYEGSEEDSHNVTLELAYNFHNRLKELYKAEGSDVLPLTAVMIPNAKRGESKLERTKLFLKEKGITETNDRLSIYLSDYKTHSSLKEITKSDSKVEFVIFKQALDTGWDCPRAQILVQFRDIKSDIFSAQTIGRFYRMPEQKHYKNEILNQAYIFTDIPRDRLNVENDGYTPNMVRCNISFIKEGVVSPLLTSLHKKRVDQGTVGPKFYNTLEKILCESLNTHVCRALKENRERFVENNLVFDVEEYEERVAKDISVDLENVEEKSSLGGYVSYDKSVGLKLSDEDRESKFESYIWNIIRGRFGSKDKSISTVKMAICKWFNEYLGVSGKASVQHIMLHPENDKLFDLVDKAMDGYTPLRKKEISKRKEKEENKYYSWSVLERRAFSDNYEEVPAKLYAHDVCYLRKSRPPDEKCFEGYLEADKYGKTDWWYKNGDSGKENFAVPYRKKTGELGRFYVDYVVRYKDGTIGLFDPKEMFAEYTEEKAAGLYKYIEENNAKGKKMVGGILSLHHGIWRINRNKNYRYNPKDMSGWEYLNDIIENLHLKSLVAGEGF